jgi:hypothetical protein
LLPLMLMLLALAAVRSGRPLAAGGLVGIALMKPTMVLPFLAHLAARRQWSALVMAAGAQAACLALASIWLGVRPERLVREWLGWARLQHGSGLIDIPSLLQAVVPSAAVVAAPLGIVLLVGTALLIEHFRSRSDLALFSAATLSAAVFAYHRPYDLVLLVPAYLFLVESARQDAERARFRTASAVVYGLLLIAPEEPFRRIGLGGLYDAAFVASAYGLVGFTLLRLKHEPVGSRFA